MGLEGGALAGAWIGGLAAGVLGLAGLLALFRWWMQVRSTVRLRFSISGHHFQRT